MKNFILVSLFTFGVFAFADEPLCVRNYAKQGGGAVCKSYPTNYANVQPMENKETEVCTRIYADFYCEQAPKEYAQVTTLDKRTICTLNYNQPPVANFCESAKEFYDYIAKAPAE